MSAADDHEVLDEPIVRQLLDLGPAVVTELIELYARQLIVLMTDIRGGDMTLARRAAHTLKGSSANLGLVHAARLAAGIEAGTAASDSADELEPAARSGLDALRARTGLDVLRAWTS